MKVVKNVSLQGLQLPFDTGNGVKYVFLTPRKQVTVPNNWRSQIAENLVHRRMVKITVTPDAIPEPTTPVKRTNSRGRK